MSRCLVSLFFHLAINKNVSNHNHKPSRKRVHKTDAYKLWVDRQVGYGLPNYVPTEAKLLIHVVFSGSDPQPVLLGRGQV